MASFIKGTKIWNRIEKKLLAGEFSAEDVGLCGAFSLESTVRFCLDMKISASRAKMIFYPDADGKRKEFEMSACEGGGFFLELPMNEISEKSGLFFYEYSLENTHGEFFVVRDNADFSDKIIDRKPQDDERFQLLIYEKREKYPEFFRGGIAYQIFPDRFFRAGHEEVKEDARFNPDWYHGTPEYFRPGDKEFKNNVFFGGDLPGVEQKLKYIASLGVTAIYLNPIFLSSSTHKYDTADYTKIDPMFGGEEAFHSLIKAAKKYKISIILDGVFNHTGDDSVYFNKYGKYSGEGAFQSEQSPYADWYNFTEFPEEYESWWGFKNLPRVMSDNPSYKKFLFEKDGIVRKYIREGICGWRLDVADELSDEFLDELRHVVKKNTMDEGLIIGEVWENAADKIAYGNRRRYLSGDQLDSVMNYPFRNAVLAFVRDGDAETFYHILTEIYASYPRTVSHSLMNLLGTHDTARILTLLGDGGKGECLPNDTLAHLDLTEEERKNALTLLKLASVLQFCAFGVPSVYYGDEAGVEGYGDPFCRKPFPWGREDADLLSHYRALGKLRREHPALACGDFRFVEHDATSFVFERQGKGERILVLANVGEERTFDIPARSVNALTGEALGATLTLGQAEWAILLAKQK